MRAYGRAGGGNKTGMHVFFIPHMPRLSFRTYSESFSPAPVVSSQNRLDKAFGIELFQILQLFARSRKKHGKRKLGSE